MPVKLIKYSFAAGVFARALHGRDDLEKYELALKEADNFVIDFGGAASSRAGFEFCDQVESSTTAARFFSFRFNESAANNYLVIFLDSKIRFVQDGAYVLEDAVTISDITGNVVTAVSHEYSTGDLVVIGGRTFVITVNSVDEFVTKDFDGVAADPDDSITSAYRVYTVATTYTTDDLAGLRFRKRRDQIVITSLDFAPALLTRSDHADWTLADFDYNEPAVDAPSNLDATASTAGSAETNFTVTAVDQEGRETVLAEIATEASIVNYADDPGSLKITWDPVAGAAYYHIYRSLVFPSTAQNSLGQQLGYIGRSYGTSFTDVNVTPAFNITPLQFNNPFLPGQVQYIEVTAGGSGYTSAPAVSVSGGGGSGFVGIALLNGDAVEAVLILNGGTGYASATVGFTGGGGSGATATATLTDTSGIYPQASAFYGQRFWLAGTSVSPMALYSGRGDNLFSFNRTQYGTAIDPYEYEIESDELTPIKYLEPLQTNLFAFTNAGAWQIAPSDSGGYDTVQRTQNGIGSVPPLAIDTELIYSLSGGAGVWALKPGTVPNTYTDANLTIFSGDFFTIEQEIISWAFAKRPYRVVWAALANGKMLSFTYLPEHNVYAWMPHTTRGQVLEVASVYESGIDRTYALVSRDTGVFIERMAHRDFATPEDIWAVDAGLANDLTTPAADLTIVLSEDETTATCTASAAVFSSGDVGSHLRAGTGRGIVTTYTSTTEVTIEMIVPITDRKPQDPATLPLFESGDWTLDAPTDVFSGLWHLAGETVEVLGDGSYMGDYVVADDGSVTLDAEVSSAIIGLPFTGYVTTLPPAASDAVITDRRKSFVGIALRLDNTRGVMYGVDDLLYEMPERTVENYGEPTRFQSGLYSLTIRTDWRTDGSITVSKEGPSAITLLGYVSDMEIGDDPE